MIFLPKCRVCEKGHGAGEKGHGVREKGMAPWGFVPVGFCPSGVLSYTRCFDVRLYLLEFFGGLNTFLF